jgi:hypothetical protein
MGVGREPRADHVILLLHTRPWCLHPHSAQVTLEVLFPDWLLLELQVHIVTGPIHLYGNMSRAELQPSCSEARGHRSLREKKEAPRRDLGWEKTTQEMSALSFKIDTTPKVLPQYFARIPSPDGTRRGVSVCLHHRLLMVPMCNLPAHLSPCSATQPDCTLL